MKKKNWKKLRIYQHRFIDSMNRYKLDIKGQMIRMSLLRLSGKNPLPSLTRSFSVTSFCRGPNDDLQRVAEQRERAQQKDANRRAELRRMARKRAAARLNPERSPYYRDIEEALRYIRAAEVGRSPNEAVLSITTNVVSQKGTQKLVGSVSFPKPIKQTRIIVFTSDPEQASKATDIGVSTVGGIDLIEQIKAGSIELNFDRAFATPELVPQLNQVARILGPRGLMPSVKKGTVSEDIIALVQDVSGTIPFRQKSDNLSISVGRVDFSDNEIIKNIVAAQRAFSQAITDQKSKKPSILGHTVLQSTHGPGIVINIK